MDGKEKRLVKAIEAALDSAVQTPDQKKQKAQLERALKYTRKLLPASRWGGELSLLRYRVGDPKKNPELSKTNFRKWRKQHLPKTQSQLVILNLQLLPKSYLASYEKLKKCPKCHWDTHPIQYQANWNIDFTTKPPTRAGRDTFTLSCPHCHTRLGECDMDGNLIENELSNYVEEKSAERLVTPSKETPPPEWQQAVRNLIEGGLQK